MFHKKFPTDPDAIYSAHSSLLQRWLPFMFVVMTGMCLAATEVLPPDLTSGALPIDSKGKTVDPLESAINLGPTGMHGWMYHKSVDSSESRQILVTSVTAGSPADGILQVNDVILGVDGKGADPKPFSSDTRVALGKAIGYAEARNPATLKLLLWRAGKQSVVSVKLQTLGDYSPTAPYNCEKSMYILEQGLKELMANQDEGVWSLNALTLLAANYPDNLANAARQAKAREWARKLILSQEEIDKRLNGHVSTNSKVGWTRGHELLVLAEYYLQTKDPDVFPTIEAMAVEVCNGFSFLGSMGHQFANPILNGKFNGPYNIGYGAINSAGLPSFFGVLLAKKCGVTRPELEPAIARSTNFYGSFAGYGTIPYGEHGPGRGSHENNGKMGLAAIAFSVEGSRDESTKFFTKMTAASAAEREVGHCGSYFNYLWAPLGANVGGVESAAAHFSRISWRLDLNRRWDGGFDYDCWYHYTTGGPKYAGRPFWASIPILLTYAMPLQQLVITGKNQNPSLHLTTAELAQIDLADAYDAKKRNTQELITDLGLWSTKVQDAASKELAARKAELEVILPQLISIAQGNSTSQMRAGACLALGDMKDGRAAAALADLITDPDEQVRWASAWAMRFMPRDSQLPHLDKLLKAAVTTLRPFEPLSDKVPLQFAHMQLSYLLFYNGTAYGPRGMVAGDQLKGVNRELLYPAIEAVSKTPMGHARGSLAATFKYLDEADVKAVSGAMIDVAVVPAPADNMFKSGVRTAALATLQDHQIAEGVAVSEILASDPNLRGREEALDTLAKYAKSSTQVKSLSEILNFCETLSRREPSLAAKAQGAAVAIEKDQSPKNLTLLKGFNSITAKENTLKLPAKKTELSVDSYDFTKGANVYTWRKVHGAGKVTFSPNGTANAKSTAVELSGTPGKYLFEVTMSDTRGLTDTKGLLEIVLQDKNGKLPSNRPPVAETKSYKIPHSTTTQIALRGTDPERYELVYEVTKEPTHGKLLGKAPMLTYTPQYGYAGSDQFTFEVTDSEGQKATGTINLAIDSTETLQVAIYEPFDYPAGLLNDQSGSSEVGLIGTWRGDAKNSKVSDGSLSFGGLLVKGGKFDPALDHCWGGTRAISPAALKANGLLNDGATLWFSAVVGYGLKSSYKNDRLSVALANNGFDEGRLTTWIVDEGDQRGSGIGFTLANHDASIGGRVQATQFRDKSFCEGANTRPNIHGSWDDQPTLIPDHGFGLIVGRITWAANPQEPDLIEIFGPISDLELPSKPVSELKTVVDQSTFDTLTFDKSGNVMLDEIRFGPSYESVLAGTKPLVTGTAAPVKE